MTQTLFTFAPRPRVKRERPAPTYNPDDFAPMLRAVYRAMCDGEWWTIRALSDYARHRLERDVSEASISARIRELRHEGFHVEREKVKGSQGLFRYRIAGVK